MSLFSFFRRPKQKARERVIFTADSVTRFLPDDVEETIRWDDLHEVGILTTNEGPWQEDVFFLLISSDGKSGCVVPQSAEGCKELVERLQNLPGFNNEELIKAMGSTDNAKFVCWKREAA